MMTPVQRRARILQAGALLLAAGLWLAACDSNDPTAPADSTITVSANPQTVVVPSGSEGVTDITATLRSKNGTRLPDQEVTFSTTAGELVPPAQTPVLTDSDGQAFSTLSTPTSATITAQSGGISGTTQIQTVSCDLATITLESATQDPGRTNELIACDDEVTFTATVEDTNGDPCVNVRVEFKEDAANILKGNFPSGNQDSSDAAGLAVVTWRPGSTCEEKCESSATSTGICGDLLFTASDALGAFRTNPVTIHDNIP